MHAVADIGKVQHVVHQSGKDDDVGIAPPPAGAPERPACFEFREARFYFADIGSNPSLINGLELGTGRQAVLAAGDQIAIGDYLLEVLISDDVMEPTLPKPPLLEVFLQPPGRPAATLPELEYPSATRSAQSDDLVLGDGNHGGRAILGISEQASPPGVALADPLTTADILRAGVLASHCEPGTDPLGPNLFGGIAPGARSASMPGVQQHTGGAFQGSACDHVSPEVEPLSRYTVSSWPALAIPEGYDALSDRLPRAVAMRVKLPVPVSVVPKAKKTLAVSVEDIMPADENADASNSAELAAEVPAARESKRRRAVARKHKPVIVDPGVDADVIADAILLESAVAALPSAEAGPNADPTLQALLRGLGLTDPGAGRSNTELAYLAGAMLREATCGAMAMLTARSLTKHEYRIEMTMIGAVSNNPLKCFSDATDALAEMLGSARPGYMKPVHAFGSGFDDLKWHELAVMAGMRAALSALLAQFDPASIEQRLDPPGVLDKVLATHRKAAMWDRLVTLHGEISREAEENFPRLFGENFARAYEEQAGRLKADSLNSAPRSITKPTDKAKNKNVLE